MKMILDRLRNSQTIGPVALATIVGALAGIGAIVFRYLIDAAHWLFFDMGKLLGAKIGFLNMGKAYIIFVPAVGMVLVSLISV